VQLTTKAPKTKDLTVYLDIAGRWRPLCTVRRHFTASGNRNGWLSGGVEFLSPRRSRALFLGRRIRTRAADLLTACRESERERESVSAPERII